MTLDIRGHTVRRDGVTIATQTYADGYTVVHDEDGDVIGRYVRCQKDPDLYYAWDAKHPAAWTPSDTLLAKSVPAGAAVEAILYRAGQMDGRYTDVHFEDSEWTPGDTALVTSNGHGKTSSEWRLADLLRLRGQLDARIEKLQEVRTDA